MHTYYIKRSFSVLIISTFLCASLIGIFSQPVSAQEAVSTSFCPIEGTVFVTPFNQAVARVFENNLFDKVKIENPTTYTFGGLRLAVGIYANETDATPQYWTVLPDVYTLTAGQFAEVELEVGIGALPKGNYYYRYFVGQGDENDLLGIALRDSAATPLSFEKTLESSEDISLAVKTKTTLADSEPITATITVTNGAAPLQDAQLITVVAQGELPLGSAVRATKNDQIKMVPNAVREVTISDNFTESGIYTLYTWLQKGSSAQPLTQVVIGVGDETAIQSNFYLSHIGLSAYPLETGATVVTCLGFLGTTDEVSFPTELLGVNVVITNPAGTEIEKSTITTEGTKASDFLSFSVSQALLDFNLKVELLEERFKSVAFGEGEGEEPAALIPVSTVDIKFSCNDLGLCPAEEVTAFNEIPLQQNPWFYVGVTIAALLLAALMVGRLQSPKKKEVIEMTKPQI